MDTTGKVVPLASRWMAGTIASAGDDGTVRVWDARSGAERSTLHGHTGKVNAVAFSPDGRSMASVGDDSTLRLWDTTSGAERLTLRSHEGPVNAVLRSRPIAPAMSSALGDDNTVRLWDGEYRVLASLVLRSSEEAAWEAVASPDSRTLATVNSYGTAQLLPIITDQAALVRRALKRVPRQLTSEELRAFYIFEGTTASVNPPPIQLR